MTSLEPQGSLIAPGGRPSGLFAWVTYGIGLAASVVTIIVAIAAAAGSGKLGGGWIFLLVFAQTTVLCVIIIFILREFSRQLGALNQSVRQLQGELLVAQRSEQTIGLSLQAARDLNDEIAQLRTFPTVDQLQVFLREACKQLSRAFSTSLGIDARVCIKQVNGDAGDRPWAEAVARSDKSIAGDVGVRHYIDDNTDFYQLVRNRAKVWFCPDIRDYEDYQTTSQPFPQYRSVIVWPVVTRVAREFHEDPRLVPIVAFLCLDTSVPNAFSEREHTPIGWTVADAIARAYEASRSILIE